MLTVCFRYGEHIQDSVSDCVGSIDDIFVHVICFDNLEASISNENGMRVQFVAMRILLKTV